MASIGDYWDEQAMCEIEELLKEHSYLFLHSFIEMKEIQGEQGEMKIEL
jgi:hypothetical protein